MQNSHRYHHGISMVAVVSTIICMIGCITRPSEAFSTNHYHIGSIATRSGIWCNHKRQPYPIVAKSLRMSTDTSAVTVVGDDDESTQTMASTTTTTTTTTSSIGLWDKVKAIVPPANERKKLIPLALMFFCILFSYTILRDTKDVLMITAPKSGAEVIPFIKTYVNLPVAIVRYIYFVLFCDLCPNIDYYVYFFSIG
jgi:hypothetical protein